MIKDDREYETSKARLDALNQEIDERRALTKVKTAARRKLRKEIETYEKTKVQPAGDIPANPPVKPEKQMRKFEVGRNARDGKPFNPIRVVIRCRKCEEESAELYRFNDRGFIKTRCSCGADNRFNMEDFEKLPHPYPSCPECSKEMEPKQLEGGNACYYCGVCNGYYPFADLLPGESQLDNKPSRH